MPMVLKLLIKIERTLTKIKVESKSQQSRYIVLPDLIERTLTKIKVESKSQLYIITYLLTKN